MSEELKPCPFCGGIKFSVNGFDEDKCCWVTCRGCNTTTKNYETKEAARQAWNKRVRAKKETKNEINLQSPLLVGADKKNTRCPAKKKAPGELSGNL